MIKRFVTGTSDEAMRIARALGLGDLAVTRLQLDIDANDVIKAYATFYPTLEQVKMLATELEKFNAGESVTAEVRLVRQSSDPETTK